MLELHQLRPPYAEGVLTLTQGEKVKPMLTSLAQRPEALDALPDLTKLSPTAEALQDWAKEYEIPLPDTELQHPFQLAVPFYDIIPVCSPRALELLDQLEVLIDDEQNQRDLIAFGDVMTALQIARDEAQEIESLKPITAVADELIDTVFPNLGAPKEPTEIILLYNGETDHPAGYTGKLNGRHVINLHAPMKAPSLSHNPFRVRTYDHPLYDNYQQLLLSFIEERAHQAHAERVGQEVAFYPLEPSESVATAEERPYSFRELRHIQQVNDSLDTLHLDITDPGMKLALEEALANAVTIGCMLFYSQDMYGSSDRRRVNKHTTKAIQSLQETSEKEYNLAFQIIHNAQQQGMSLPTLVDLIISADLVRFYQQSPESPEMQQLIANPFLLQSYTA